MIDTDVVQTAAQPFTSVTVTEYEPAVRLLTCAVVAPVLHRYVYGDVPLVADTEADAWLLFEQLPFVGVHVATGTGLMVMQTMLLSPPMKLSQPTLLTHLRKQRLSVR